MDGRAAAAVITTAVLVVLFASVLQRAVSMMNAADVVKHLQPLITFYRNSTAWLAKFNHKWTALVARAALHPLVQLAQLAKYLKAELTVTDTKFDAVPVRVYVPKTLQSDGAMIFFHGGGFVLFNVDSYDGLARDLAIEAGMVTVSVNYRLAPEHLFPAAVEDCERAVVHFLRHAHKRYNVDPNKVVLIGDSAGGNLVAVITQRLRRLTDVPRIKLQILIYPFMQLIDFNTPSYCNAKHAYQKHTIVDPESIARFMIMYLGLEDSLVPTLLANSHSSHLSIDHLNHGHLPEMFKAKPRREQRQRRRRLSPDVEGGERRSAASLDRFLLDPNFSPIVADDLNDLPAALLITCEYDALRDEGYLYAKRLYDNGVQVAWWHLKAGFHGMFNMHRILPSARMTVNRIGQFVRDQLVDQRQTLQPAAASTATFAFPDVQFLP